MKYFLTFFFILSFSFAQAQLVESTELEIPLDENVEDDFSVIPLDTSGVLLMNHQASLFGKKSKLILIKVDKNLKEVWRNTIEVSSDYQLVKYYLGRNSFYCLLKELDSQKIKIIKLNFEYGDAIITECKMLTNMEVEFFAAIDNKVVISGVYNDKPVAELVRLFDRTSKVLPHVYSNNLKIISLEINDFSKEIYLMLKDENKCKFLVTVFDYEGKLTLNKYVGEKNRVILNSKILKISDSNIYLAGNFSENCTEFSSGFYFAPFSNLDKIQYFKFSELQNFYTNLSLKKQEKIKNKLKNKKEKGKEPKLRYRLNLQQPIITDDEVLLAAEVYYPEYKNSSVYTRSSLIHLGENYRTIRDFNNYQFSQGLVCTFDFLGNKTWDYSIDLNSLESEVLSDKMQATHTADGILIAYPKNDQIFMKLVSKNNPMVEFEALNIVDKSKEMVSDVSVELFSWYKKTFLAFGYKRGRLHGDISGQQFFYIKKLTYQTPELK